MEFSVFWFSPQWPESVQIKGTEGLNCLPAYRCRYIYQAAREIGIGDGGDCMEALES